MWSCEWQRRPRCTATATLCPPHSRTAHTPRPLPLSTRLEIMRKNGMVFRFAEQELTVNLKGAQKTDQ
jgi:hypothetical protein